MDKIKWSEKVTNEVLKHTGEKRMLLNNILRRKASWIGHILHNAIEGQITEVKGVARRTRLFNYLRNRRRYWGLKKEDEDLNR